MRVSKILSNPGSVTETFQFKKVGENYVLQSEAGDEELEQKVGIHKRLIHYSNWSLKNNKSVSYIQYIFPEDGSKPLGRKLEFLPVAKETLVNICIGPALAVDSLLFSDGAFSELLNSIDEVVLISEPEPIDTPGPRIIYLNDAFKKMTGFGDEILGKTPRELQGEETSEETRKTLRTSFEKWEPVKVEIYNYKKDGTPFWVELNIKPVKDITGWWSHWISIQREITDEVEERTRMENLATKLLQNKNEIDDVLESAKIGFWSLDLNKNILHWDKSMYRLYEVDQGDFAGDYEAWERTLHPDDYSRANQEFINAISHKDTLELQFRIVTKLGDLKHIKLNAKILRNEKGIPLLMKGINIDITNEVQLVGEVEKEQIKSIHRDKLASIGELAAGIAHEVNNPLAISSGVTQMLRRLIEKRNLDTDRFLEHLEQQTQAHLRIKDIIDGLRVYSRINEEENVLVNIQNIVTVTMKFIKNIFEKSGIHFTLDVDEEDILVYCNFGKMQQCLVNLLNNAKDAVENVESPEITLRVHKKESNISICVEDNGEGISQTDKEKIFDPFFTTKEIGVGTGLGLSIVSKLVSEMNGQITVHSEPGKGTSFCLTLPAS